MKPTLLRTSFLLVLVTRVAPGAEPTRLDTGSREGRQPQVAVADDQHAYVTFGAGNEVFVASSTDGGQTFGVPAKVGGLGAISLGSRRGPRIAAGEQVVVTAIGGKQGRGRDGDLVAWRSSDRGKSWIGPVRVNDAADSAREGLHAMAMGPQGELFCVWLDLRTGSTELMGSASTDGGETWSRNQLVYRSPSGSICECCHPAVAFDSEGKLYVMWRNSLNGFRDMYSAISQDGGKTFSKAGKLGIGSWRLQSCPMDGGYLAAMRPGKLTAVWRRDQQVYSLASGERLEQELGQGLQPWVAGTTKGAYVIWLARKGGALWLLEAGKRQPKRLVQRANDPVIAAPIAGTGPVICAWESGGDIMTFVVTQP